MTYLKLFIFIIMLTYAYVNANAATEITNEMTEKYFNTCIANAEKQGKMSTESQKNYCACTAMNMQKTMSQEDLAMLSGKNEQSRLVLNKILIDVNGPCMQYPTHDLVEQKCMTDLKNAAICNCLSNKMAQFTAQQSQKMMPKLLADNPDLFDPLTPIMESQEFQQTQQSIALSCATNPNQQ